jgi:hypothetical protein
MWDDDDEDDIELAFEWDALHILHTYAWKAASARLRGVSIVLGLQLIDAIKTEALDEAAAEPYVAALSRAEDTGNPLWD